MNRSQLPLITLEPLYICIGCAVVFYGLRQVTTLLWSVVAMLVFANIAMAVYRRTNGNGVLSWW